MEKDQEKLLFLDPVCTHNIWGGNRLNQEYGCRESGDDIGECWGISAHPNGDGVIKSGTYQGIRLSQLWREHRELFGNTKEEEFPLLVKILDAREDLSIQVHPNDTFADRNENHALGKTECWYILDCPKDASLVIGHNASSTQELEQMIDEERWGELIREIPVKKGDFIQINPGTVHAIKAGFVILETQQSSNITYRVYDYDRLQNGAKRELHIDKCKQVITTPASTAAECIISAEKLRSSKNTMEVIYAGMYYEVFMMSVQGVTYAEQKYCFLNVTVTEGSGLIDGVPVSKGCNLIIPYEYGVVKFEGEMDLILSTIR